MPILDVALATVQAEFSDLPDAEQRRRALPMVPNVMRRPGRRIRHHRDHVHPAQEAA